MILDKKCGFFSFKKANFYLDVPQNEVRLGLVGQIPRSFKGDVSKIFLGGVKES